MATTEKDNDDISPTRSIIMDTILSSTKATTLSVESLSLENESDDDNLWMSLNKTLSSSESSSASDEGVFADKMSKNDDDDDEFVMYVPKYFQAIITLFVCFFLLFFTLAIIQQTRRLCQRSSCNKKKIPLQTVSMRKVSGSEGHYKDSPSDFACVVTDSEGNYQRPAIDNRLIGDRHFDYYTRTSSSSPTQELQREPQKTISSGHHHPSSQSPAAAASNDVTPKEKDAVELELEAVAKSKDKEAHDLLKLKKVRFDRRVSESGPFGEDAIDFVGQTYKAKYMEAPLPKKTGEVFHKKQSIKKPPPPP